MASRLSGLNGLERVLVERGLMLSSDLDQYIREVSSQCFGHLHYPKLTILGMQIKSYVVGIRATEG